LVSGSADWTVRCWDIKGAGGLPTKQNGASINGFSAADGNRDNELNEPTDTIDLLESFPTKRTPIINVHFTPRNLCLVAGPYLSPEQR